MAKEITDSNFEEVTSTDKLVVVDMWAPWCGPCRMVGPIIENISDELNDVAVVGKCNVDENAETSLKFGIRSIPTVLLIKNGVVVDKLVGALSKESYMEKINQHLN